MADHRKRFEHWRSRLPAHTAYLVEGVLTRLLPELEARSFAWHRDYAGGDAKEIAAHTLPLQRREGEEWPTVEIHFANRAHPWFSVYFAALPAVCRRPGKEPVPREKAIVVYAPAWFRLCKGESRGLDGQFGYHWFALRPRGRLDAELDKALRLLPVVFDLFDRGIPREWLARERGLVTRHIRLMSAWPSSRIEGHRE